MGGHPIVRAAIGLPYIENSMFTSIVLNIVLIIIFLNIVSMVASDILIYTWF